MLRVNEIFQSLGASSLKPVLTALALPPVPLLLLTLVGARLIPSRRGWGWMLVMGSVAGLWLSGCSASAEWLQRTLLQPPPALTSARVAELRESTPSGRGVIVVLGGGVMPFAPEYGRATLLPASVERLRYGLWLGRETGLPVGFSGGAGHAQPDAPAEADVAATLAAREFGRPLAFVENGSRDTRENAARTLALLKGRGVDRIVLVTQAYHMPRSLRAFEQAAARAGVTPDLVPAPIETAPVQQQPALRWMPGHEGQALTRRVLREWLGLLAGA